MPNQTPQVQPTAGNQPLDPQAVNLAKAIRQTESNGNFTQAGKSGEYGAYQFLPATWDQYSKEAGVNAPLQQATPEQQNEVAYKKIKQWKDQGYNPGQIASMWNAGPGKPNVYLEGNKGTNAEGVQYDTAAYAKKVAETYQQLKQQNPLAAQTAQASSGQDQSQPQEGLISKAVDFAFPILNDFGSGTGANKSGLQKLGDAGLSALWFVPGLGEGAEAAIRGAGLLGEAGAKIAGQAIGGAATGYGADVSSKLASGKTDPGKILTPGIGTLAGGPLGAASSKVGSILDKFASKTPTSQLEAQTNRLKTLQKSVIENSSKDTNPIQTLEQLKMTPKLKVVNGKVDAGALTNTDRTGEIDNLIEQHADDTSHLVGSLKGTVNTNQFKNDILAEIQNNPVIRDAGKIPQAEAEIERRFASYQRSFGQEMPWQTVDNIRKAMNREWDPALRDVARTIGDTARSYLYNGDATNEALRSAMANEAELIRTQNFVQKLHGTTVPGGQLGKYFADMIGAGAGGAVGSIGGPIGAGLGTLAGGYAAHKATNLVQGSYFNPKTAKMAGLLQSLFNKPAVSPIIKTGILRSLTQ